MEPRHLPPSDVPAFKRLVGEMLSAAGGTTPYAATKGAMEGLAALDLYMKGRYAPVERTRLREALQAIYDATDDPHFATHPCAISMSHADQTNGDAITTMRVTTFLLDMKGGA